MPRILECGILEEKAGSDRVKKKRPETRKRPRRLHVGSLASGFQYLGLSQSNRCSRGSGDQYSGARPGREETRSEPAEEKIPGVDGPHINWRRATWSQMKTAACNKSLDPTAELSLHPGSTAPYTGSAIRHGAAGQLCVIHNNFVSWHEINMT